MDELGRRTLLRRLTLASAGTVVLAGCTVQSGNDEPEPVVVTNNPNEMVVDGSFDDARGEQVEIALLVHNPGSTSDLEITVTAKNDNNTDLASTTQVFSFEGGEQKEITLEFTIPSNSAYIEATAARVSNE